MYVLIPLLCCVKSTKSLNQKYLKNIVDKKENVCYNGFTVTLRIGEVVSHLAHNQEVIGANPISASKTA